MGGSVYIQFNTIFLKITVYYILRFDRTRCLLNSFILFIDKDTILTGTMLLYVIPGLRELPKATFLSRSWACEDVDEEREQSIFMYELRRL